MTKLYPIPNRALALITGAYVLLNAVDCTAETTMSIHQPFDATGFGDLGAFRIDPTAYASNLPSDHHERQQMRLGFWASPQAEFTHADVDTIEALRSIHGAQFGMSKVTPKAAGRPNR